jgi:hypothetical protein
MRTLRNLLLQSGMGRFTISYLPEQMKYTLHTRTIQKTSLYKGKTEDPHKTTYILNTYVVIQISQVSLLSNEPYHCITACSLPEIKIQAPDGRKMISWMPAQKRAGYGLP